VTRIVTMDGDLEEAVAGQAVTLTLADEIDISRGEMLSAPDAPPLFTRHPEANLVWLGEEPLQPGQLYLVKTASFVTPGRITAVLNGIDVNTLEQTQVATLGLNGIGVVTLELDRPVPLDPYRYNRHTGSFIVIDRFTNATVAAGMVSAAPQDADTVTVSRYTPRSREAGKSEPASVRLDEAATGAAAAGAVDLTTFGPEMIFELAPAFISYLGRGNRVLLRLQGVEQVTAVAALALEHRLSFEFDPLPDGIAIVLYRRGIFPVGSSYADDGRGI
jgi:sulfate adenylyltransferase subunit 1